ncbi:GNAT family N-acetyltransferase [Cellulomonas fimi]|uniref:GNAT family N-acetyltransferase n=1 Tax=Cellulomonas fimi TaxID=1708 RepID=UPI00234C94D5|nr:GNAT family N-acetyltransferase [Cellulomonas fimi]MDC7120378.1 GNAT family N-acetyltransferase [Cellulomonas fimi]
MRTVLSTPTTSDLPDVLRALRTWQDDAAPVQLHPGDLGWYWRFGEEAVARALRTWTRDGEILTIGFLDGPQVLRATVAPRAWHDDELAREVVDDASDPERGVLPTGAASVEAPNGTSLHAALTDAGWHEGEAWTPLRRDLVAPVEAPDLRVELVEPGRESAFTAVHRSAWGTTTFTDERWRVMAAGPAFADAWCLLARDAAGLPVAGVTVWSAGPGRPGLLEPMGVHADHRGRGYGRSICLAAAAELRRRGASSALVCTPTSLTSAVATYASAGFRRLPERLDRSRDA